MVDTVVEVAVPARLPEVGSLRRAVDDVLCQWTDGTRRNQILLAVSELGTNAIEALRDPGSEIRLRICNLDDRIVIEIEDAGPGITAPAGETPPDNNERGRGLQIVQAVADDFAVDRTNGRTTVRCAFTKD